MRSMSPDQRREFLLAGKRTARLASINQDGSPHVVPVWFDLDGDDIIFTTWHTTVKRANLEREPRVALSVADDTPPYSFVMISGVAQLDFHAPDLLNWTTRLARRYLGETVAEQYGKRNAVEGEILVRVIPTKFVAQEGLAD